MADKKKVLFFLWSFSLGGGAEKILATIANNLDPDKYDIDILEMEHYDKGYPDIADHVHILRPYKSKRHSRFIESFLWRIRFIFPNLIRSMLVKDDYDVEISFTIMNPPLPFSKRADVKRFEWIHGTIENMPENPRYYELHREHLATVSLFIYTLDEA